MMDVEDGVNQERCRYEYSNLIVKRRMVEVIDKLIAVLFRHAETFLHWGA